MTSLNILAGSLCCVEKENGAESKGRRVTGGDTTAVILQQTTVARMGMAAVD